MTRCLTPSCRHEAAVDGTCPGCEAGPFCEACWASHMMRCPEAAELARELMEDGL